MAVAAVQHDAPDEQTYQRRIRSWALYDWANSAFATTIMAAVLPVYYSTVAGSTLPSSATATAYWSLTLSFSLFIIALLSPILGTISDLMRGKKKFLSVFVLIGIIGTGLLVLAGTGDWFLASLMFVIGRVGFSGANIFYDALLPHVAKEEDQDRVSTYGFALGYLGGGILLAINVVMIFVIPDFFENAGTRLTFLSVAIWWGIFSIPILRNVPEPPSATADYDSAGENVIGASFKRLWKLLRSVSQYRELFKYLVSFLIYNDAINTIIGIAVIYGAELGFDTIELILALLLVQFVGIPFSLIFGSLPSKAAARRHLGLAFIIFNAITMPLAGIIAASVLPEDVTGKPPAPYVTENDYWGEDADGQAYGADKFVLSDGWETDEVTTEEQVPESFMGQLTLALSPPDAATYLVADSDDRLDFQFNGQQLELTYAVVPNGGQMAVEIDGVPLMVAGDDDTEVPLVISTANDILRYGETETITALEPGQHTLTLVVSGGNVQVNSIKVMPPLRGSSLPTIFGILVAVQAVGVVFAFVFGRFFKPLAESLDTRRSILLSLAIYCVIAVWGFFLSASIEFWFLAWMVAIVQGGSQALSRSLYAHMCPASKSGEFFGLFSIMSKFASIVGPLLFALAVALFGSSRPAVLSLIVLFVIGGFMLTRVNIAEGHRVAREEDAKVLGTQSA